MKRLLIIISILIAFNCISRPSAKLNFTYSTVNEDTLYILSSDFLSNRSNFILEHLTEKNRNFTLIVFVDETQLAFLQRRSRSASRLLQDSINRSIN